MRIPLLLAVGVGVESSLDACAACAAYLGTSPAVVIVATVIAAVAGQLARQWMQSRSSATPTPTPTPTPTTPAPAAAPTPTTPAPAAAPTPTPAATKTKAKAKAR